MFRYLKGENVGKEYERLMNTLEIVGLIFNKEKTRLTELKNGQKKLNKCGSLKEKGIMKHTTKENIRIYIVVLRNEI